MLEGHVPHLCVVDALLVVEPVGHGAEELARQVHGRAVGEVPAMRERHAEERVARLEDREVHRLVRLRSRMRLHVGVLGAEEPLHALESERLGHVDELAPAVIALARITLGVLVREHRALGLEHGLAHVVLRGDELEVVFLARALAGDRLPQLRVDRGDAAAGPLGAHAPGGDGNRAHAAFSTGNCVPGAGARAGAALHTVRSSIHAQA